MLAEEYARVDAELSRWEARLRAEEPLELEPALEAASSAALALIRATIAAERGKAVPAEHAGVLDAFKVLVKGDPTWNAIRDNLRELVYYRNSLTENRRDALPAVPERMAIRTARHVYLYMKTRCQREGWL